ncbi:MAG: hypothetical protein VW835_01505 [Rickettsiales bacterium]
MQRANKSDIGGLHLLLFDEDPQYAQIRADYEHVSAARDAGVNALVVKPVSASDLRDHILDALDKLHHPFVECDAYTGPDRRHESTTAYRGRERRGAPIPLK